MSNFTIKFPLLVKNLMRIRHICGDCVYYDNIITVLHFVCINFLLLMAPIEYRCIYVNTTRSLNIPQIILYN